MKALFGYFQDSLAELRHVTWPSRREVVRHSIIILVSVAVATLIIAILDYGLGLLVNRFILQ